MFEQLIAHHARIRPDALAIVAPDRLLTFLQFESEIAGLQRLLASRPFLPYKVIDHVRAGRLALVLENLEPRPPPVHLVHDRLSRLPLKLCAFVDFEGSRIKTRVAEAAL